MQKLLIAFIVFLAILPEIAEAQPPTAPDSLNLSNAETPAVPEKDLPTKINPMGQITNVSELRDVSPADWAYEALRSLVERYGCLTGDRSFRGTGKLTRREFAAGISICLNSLKQKIQENLAVAKEDLDTIKGLQAEFF